MGSLLAIAGEKGMRYALPNARIMVHQPSGGYQGQATDIMIHAEETQKLKKRLTVMQRPTACARDASTELHSSPTVLPINPTTLGFDAGGSKFASSLTVFACFTMYWLISPQASQTPL